MEKSVENQRCKCKRQGYDIYGGGRGHGVQVPGIFGTAKRRGYQVCRGRRSQKSRNKFIIN